MGDLGYSALAINKESVIARLALARLLNGADLQYLHYQLH